MVKVSNKEIHEASNELPAQLRRDEKKRNELEYQTTEHMEATEMDIPLERAARPKWLV